MSESMRLLEEIIELWDHLDDSEKLWHVTSAWCGHPQELKKSFEDLNELKWEVTNGL